VWNFGGDIIIIIIIIIIILASPFNQYVWHLETLPVASITHTGIPTLDHGKNREQNLGWLLIQSWSSSSSEKKNKTKQTKLWFWF